MLKRGISDNNQKYFNSNDNLVLQQKSIDFHSKTNSSRDQVQKELFLKASGTEECQSKAA